MQSNWYKPHYKNVPQSWVICKLADVCYVESGYAFSSDDYSRSGTPLVRISNIIDSQISLESCVYINSECDKRFHVKKGDLLIAMSGATTGKMGVYDSNETAFLNQRVGNIKVINENVLLNDYRNIFMYSQIGNILELAYGGAQPNISANIICSLPIPIPSIKEQKRIIMAVGKWFSLIDTLETAKEDLQTSIEYTKSKILDLAIHGKLVPQDPNDEPAIELLSRINPRFTPCDNAHDTNQLPDSWCWTTLGDVCKLVTGSTPSKLHPEYYGGDFPFYKPTDLDAGRHVNIPSEFLTDEGKNVSRIIPVGSTAICCIGSIGKCGYIEKEGTTNQQINTAVPSKSLSPLYLYYFCNSSYFIDELSADSSAITISIVNKSKLSKMLISLPPYNEQLRIVAKIEELFAVLDEIQKSIEA